MTDENTQDAKPVKKKTGFGANPENINRKGRPKGAKGKKSRALRDLEKQVLYMQSGSVKAARLQYAIMTGEPDLLAEFKISFKDIDPFKVITMQMKASDAFLKLSREMPDLVKEITEAGEEGAKTAAEEDLAPVVSLTPKQA